jgi:hypothetical protein
MFFSPRSPRSVTHAAATTSDALNPASPSRDINAIVEDAAKRFGEMDDDLKSLLADMKDYQASMVQLNENRLKTARHMATFATANSPFANFVTPGIPEAPMKKAVVGTEVDSGSADSRSVATDEAAGGEAESSKTNEAEATSETKDKEVKTEEKEIEEKEVKVPAEKVEAVEKPKAKTEDAKPKADNESFEGVHQSAYNMSKKYHEQYGQYLIGYVENWEKVVSQRIHGLLIHYRELEESVMHYNKKVGGLLEKVDRSKSVRHKLAEKLDRNEIKEMGAVEARDTVGEHLYLYIEEVIERAWRDVFPLVLRSCRFEADFNAAQASILSDLVTVSDMIQSVGEDEDCDIMGRLGDLEKKHPEEVCTEENPFVKLTPRKKKEKQPDMPDIQEGGSADQGSEPQPPEDTLEVQPEDKLEV